MKKILAALLVASFGAGLMAQNLVYDYKASIKRLDAQFSVKSEKTKGKFVAASYKVASDTISGYVVLPVCKGCDKDNGVSTSLSFSSITDASPRGWAYLVRKGDKLSKKAGIPYVLVTPLNADAAIFGAYTTIADADADKGKPLANVKAANKAWMALDYALPDNATTIDSDPYVLKNVQNYKLTLGFLGLTNSGIEEGSLVQHTGFGTAKVTDWKTASTLGWCSSVPGEEGSCQFVSSISGTLVGYPTYAGPCETTPMWNVCYPTIVTTVSDGVISGSWTLKYNKSATEGYNEKGASYIYGKLGDKIIEKRYVTSSSAK